MPKSVVMALYFYPRGGSAQVVRYLAGHLKKSVNIKIFSGSLGEAGAPTHARTFFADLDPTVLDYSAADREWRNGRDPLRTVPPMHGSFEDRPGVPDTFLANISPELAELQTAAWRRLFSLEESEPDIAHLHHLTPMHDAVFDLWSNAKVVTHLHGTELKMLQQIRETSGLKYGGWWTDRMRNNANRSHVLITVSPQDRDLAIDLLSIPADKVMTIPNGVDVEVFQPADMSDDQRFSNWKEWLVTDPQGWKPDGGPGSVRYSEADLSAFRNADGSLAPILLYVGRFLAFKRVDILLEAYSKFRATSRQSAPLVIWGGFPGEWEGEHPYEIVKRRAIPNVFFVGWRGHEDLPRGLASANVFVAPSVNEPFGQVFLEAMSCGLPVITTATGGPKDFINVRGEKETGWLVNPDDPNSLATAMVEAIDNIDLRESRGHNARLFVEREYSWTRISNRVVEAYESTMVDD